MNEAAARGAVMAGAEGEPRLDLDADIVQADARTIMAPMDKKAPRPHRRKAGERARHPVALLGDAERRRPRGLLVRRGSDERTDLFLVRLRAEIGLHEPSLAAARPSLAGLEGRRRRFARLEALDNEVGDRPRAPLIGRERQAVSGVVGRQTFEHGGPNKSKTNRPNPGKRAPDRLGAHPDACCRQRSRCPSSTSSRASGGWASSLCYDGPRRRQGPSGRGGSRLRIGGYRVIFDEDATTIVAIYIGRRATTTYKRS